MYDGNAKTTPEGYLSYPFLLMVGQSVNGYLEYKKHLFTIPVPKSELVHDLEAVTNYDSDYLDVCEGGCRGKGGRGEGREGREGA